MQSFSILMWVNLALLGLTVILLVVLLSRSARKDRADDSAIEEQVAAQAESLRRMEQGLAVTAARLDGMDRQSASLNQLVDARLAQFSRDSERLGRTVENRLEEIRSTVDEKLQTTLENRLSTSFSQVGTQLESVYKQLGEMQNLAHDVGNLQKVLTNVKTRGVWGELQAERILQDILLPEQYLKNVVTRPGSKDPVEFAVRLPGPAEGEYVLLPVDSKFPREDYERLCSAMEKNDVDSVRTIRKALERRIADEASAIREKYISVPQTTDFAVMFLPVEGLFAEVLSVPGLQERLQREYHIMVAGPTTLASLLNSLQMGFRTLAIEKRSSEVWHVLGEVKTEFSRFGTALEAVRKKLSTASSEIDSVFVRQRAVQRKLRDVEAVESVEDNAADD